MIPVSLRVPAPYADHSKRPSIHRPLHCQKVGRPIEFVVGQSVS